MDAVTETIAMDGREISACEWRLPEALLQEKDLYPFNRGLFEIAASLDRQQLFSMSPFVAWNGNTHILHALPHHAAVMNRQEANLKYTC
jgi:hypothetical protein